MRVAVTIGALMLAGCAANVERQASQRAEADSDLARMIGDRVAGAPQDCIPATGTSGPTIIDGRRIVYRVGGRLYLNTLAAECPSLRPLNTVIVEVNGAQLCRNDRFQAVEPGMSIPGPLCLLGRFTPYASGR